MEIQKIRISLGAAIALAKSLPGFISEVEEKNEKGKLAVFSSTPDEFRRSLEITIDPKLDADIPTRA